MDDLTATRLCAEAMGLRLREPVSGRAQMGGPPEIPGQTLADDFGNDSGENFDPLHDDAQAMALVKAWRMTIWNLGDNWRVCVVTRPMEDIRVENADLNRAIVLCVAALQARRDDKQ